MLSFFPFSPPSLFLKSPLAHAEPNLRLRVKSIQPLVSLSLSLSLTEDLFSVARVGTPFSFNSCLASSLAGPSFQLLIAKEENNDENDKTNKRKQKRSSLSLSLSLSQSHLARSALFFFFFFFSSSRCRFVSLKALICSDFLPSFAYLLSS